MKFSALGIIGCVALFVVLLVNVPANAEDKLTASDEWSYDLFGFATAIDGDTAVIGAHGNDGAYTNTGAAYIFEWDDATGAWVEITILIASDAGEQDKFGCSVAISRDIVVVGAWVDDGVSADSGSAYVFYRDHGGPGAWGEVTKLMADDATAEARFGFSTAIDGDLVVVGAYLDDGGAILDSGSAYLFDRNLGGADAWGQLTKIAASDGAEGDRFSISVAIRDTTAIVGSGRHDSAAVDAGAAYVFNRDYGGPDAWGEAVKLMASDAATEDRFGEYGVSFSAGRALIGAYADDGPMGTNSGSAYVFHIPFFADGFESGDTDMWDSVTP